MSLLCAQLFLILKCIASPFSELNSLVVVVGESNSLVVVVGGSNSFVVMVGGSNSLVVWIGIFLTTATIKCCRFCSLRHREDVLWTEKLCDSLSGTPRDCIPL